MRLEAREKRVAGGGGAVAAALLVYLLWPAGGASDTVELVPADERPAPAAAVQAPAVAGAPPAPAAATPEGLVLHGVMASGAVIGFADGSQRYVGVGRDVMPGLTLESVRLHHAVLASGAASYRLGFGGAAAVVAGQASPAAAPAASAPAFSAAESQRLAAERTETSRLRQALSPRQAGGRVTGYALRPGFSVPALAQAGVLPGDTILAVNGSRLGPEQLEELAWTIANSDRTQLDVERNGRRIRLGTAADN